MKKGATSMLFRSDDYGLTFTDISSKFQLEDGSNAVINKFYHHPKSICRYVFADIVNRHVFTSVDCGETIDGYKVESFVPSMIDFDERRDQLFFVHDLQSTNKPVFVTKNFGQTFSPVQDYVKSFSLKYHSNQTELFIQRFEPSASGSGIDPNRTTILSSMSLFERHEDTKIVYVGAKEFQQMGKYLFITRVNEDDQSLDLLISTNEHRFVKALLEDEQKTLDFHIVNVDEDGQILLVANHNNALSNLYMSTHVSAYEAKFSLALERVMYYSPNVTWHDSWLAATAGDQPFVDVYKVQGLRGIFIASQISMDFWKTLSANKTPMSVEPKDLVSLITYNGGSTWSPLEGPVHDSDGRKISNCTEIQFEGRSFCSLHLAQQLSKKFPSTRSIPIISSGSAVGTIIGSGNTGKTLRQRTNVFISADAGVSWHQVLKGSYYVQIGDHGGLIVAVKYFKTEGATNQLLYSTNEGITWKKVTFYTEPLRVFGLLTEPGETTTVFTIFGTPAGSSVIDWIIVRVDLSSVFEKNCTETDFKRWSPSDGTRGKHRNCILGRKYIYERRIVNATCYNGRESDKQVTVENCLCDRSDYQCDFGYLRDKDWSGDCIRDPNFADHNQFEPPMHCRPGQFFNQTRGYAKITGDTCSGGKEDVYGPFKVACPVEDEKEFLLVAQRSKIVRIDLMNVSHVDTLPLPQLKNVIAMDFDMEDNCVIYGDIELDKIFIQCLNGTPPRVLVENNLNVEGMSLDWIGKVLYFVDGHKHTIEAVRTDLAYSGRMRKTILDKTVLRKPRGIAVQPVLGLLFYSDWAEDNPHIGRANMDGSDPKIIVSSSIVRWPNGLSIDPIMNKLFWVDAQKDLIASCDFDGSGIKQVLDKHPTLLHPFSVTVHKNLVFWDDWDKKALFMADKNSGKGVVKVLGDLSGAMEIKAFTRLHQVSANNSCSSKPCSHLCVPTYTGYACLCPDGLKTSKQSDGTIACLCPDNKTKAFSNGTCPATIANGTSMICDSETEFSCSNQVCIPKMWQCDGDDDCGDSSDEKTCRANHSGKLQCKKTQFACGNGEKCIPMMWRCDFDNDCSDGSDEVQCNTTTCTPNNFQCNNGQCISSKWRCDLEKDCQDGSDEENCTMEVVGCKDDEFQCGTNGQCIPNTWKCGTENDCPGGEDERQCSEKTCQDWQFSCTDGLCIFQTWQCDGDQDCVDGSDELNCTQSEDKVPTLKPILPVPNFPKGSECNEWMFKCANDQCIPYWWKCDGSPDCTDKSDEYECGKVHTQPAYLPGDGDEDTDSDDNGYFIEQCGPTKFSCPSGGCIWQAWVCDGQLDCDNGEDEDKAICSDRPPPCDPNKQQFRCEESGQCIEYDQICDGHQDCTDNSDELGCSTIDQPAPIIPNCEGPGLFKCGFGQCFPESALCDGVIDCIDETDEPPDCDVKQFLPQIVSLGVVDEETTSTSIKVDWLLSDLSKANEFLYKPAFTIFGENRWTEMEWTKLPDFSYTFKNLFPYTKYNLKLDLKIGTDTSDKTNIITATTSPDVPGPPTITNVTQTQDNVEIKWTPPGRPNGPLLKYTINLYPVMSDGKLGKEDAVGAKTWDTQTADQTSFLIGSLEPDRKYAFTVRAVNSLCAGNVSDVFEFVYQVKNKFRVTGLKVVDLSKEDSVRLQWSRPSSTDKTLTYRVSTKSEIILAKQSYQTFNDANTKTDGLVEYDVKNLSPDTSYILGVSVVEGDNVGPEVRISMKTIGKKFPKPIITDAQVSPESGISIKLTWELPEDEKRQSGWTYAIFYGTSEDDLLSNGLRNTTNENSFTVRHLEACQSYSFVVVIIKNESFGPPSAPFTRSTKYSPGAAPKNIKAKLDPTNKSQIVLSWEASCPDVGDIGYLIVSTDMKSGESKEFKLARQNASVFNHTFSSGLKFGTTYSIYVKTDDPNSYKSQSVNVSTLPLPVPEALRNHPDMTNHTHVILWNHPDKKLVGYLKDDFNKTSYRLYVSAFPNMSQPLKIIDVSGTSYRLPMSELGEGQLYFLAVTLVDKTGYESRHTDPIAIETPVSPKSLVVSSSNVAEVLVPILLVMVALSGALIYYVRRNRRLSRSFQYFTSRYSQASGSASILNPNSLDDEDDYSPIIRGFSDNEPLVVSS